MSSLSLFSFEPTDDPAGPSFCTVSELTAQIKMVLEEGFAEVAVQAEVSNLARPRSGHVYLSLKDDSAQIRAVLWKSEAQRIVFELTDGLAVRVWGRLAVYAPRGEYQLVIRRIEPEGIGALELAFRQTVARLAAEGLFDPARKRPLPRFPRRIVVVTSPSGAAVRDLLQVIGRRWRASEILIAPSRVQGAGAAAEVVAALALANRVAGADLIIVARGGGSLEDLWTFNEEAVARAIVASRLPVVSAIGHEIDVTIADLAADRRALTPSEAGEICVPDAEEVRRAIDRLAAAPRPLRPGPDPGRPRSPRPPGRPRPTRDRPRPRRPPPPPRPPRRRARGTEPPGRPRPWLQPHLCRRRHQPAPLGRRSPARRPDPDPPGKRTIDQSGGRDV